MRHQLVIAPPGTGKTTVSIRLAGELIGELPEEARVLLMTFSNQARTQLEREAARQLSPSQRGRVEITNYHRFFLQAVSAYQRALGLAGIDIGSKRRRTQALEAVDRDAARAARDVAGLVESLAEHAFPDFRDQRTPEPEVLERLLAAVHDEQRAGRLVFDDLGALFWKLLNDFPIIERAYRQRYPVVIADEHQDASALQDAVVRRLSSIRLTVFADPMQLIHGFRGASEERLQRHENECEERTTFGTSHRWHGNEALSEWLLAVRRRLSGEDCAVQPPEELIAAWTNPQHGTGPVKAQTAAAIRRSREANLKRVAVIVRSNQEATDIRGYLSNQGLRPRQIGGNDFEEAREDIEQLPLLNDPRTLATHALDRIKTLVPTLPSNVANQVEGRLEEDGVRLTSAGADARCILEAFACLYERGQCAYFEAVASAFDGLAARGHHLPRGEAVKALRETALVTGEEGADLELALAAYAERTVAVTHMVAPRLDDGLFVMTAHQAKGKEFDTVILVNPLARLYPDDEEGRKLFYVAVTRATKRWVVIGPRETTTPLVAALGL